MRLLGDFIMAVAVKLSDQLVSEAKRVASVSARSVPKQIEYWSTIGHIAEENPELSYQMIKGILLSQQDIKDNQVMPYQFG